MEDLRKVCFFCNKKIEQRKSLEHVIPNSLLGKLGIKEETISSHKETQYSRLKVPAHSDCNNRFGSNYEKRIIALLADIDSLYESIKSEESSVPIVFGPDETVTAIVTTWLSKIYYGLFYYDLISTENKEWRDICLSIVTGLNFQYVRASYENGHGFQLPSSLYVFRTNNSKADLVTLVDPSSILFKVGTLTFVLCICDGYLTKNYLNAESLDRLRDLVKQQDEKDINFPSHKLAFGEITALRSCIPKTPKFISSENQIINMSLTTMVANPDEYYSIDYDMLNRVRTEILRGFNITLG